MAKPKSKNENDPRLHFVVATAIISKGGKFLIAKRSMREKAFPGKWTVPGGKLVLCEYKHLPRSAKYGQWYNLIDWVLRKEVREEVGLEIQKPQYLCDLVFIRPDGWPVATLSYWAKHKKGTVKLGKDLEEYAWVTVKEAKKYDLIEGIYDEIKQVAKLI
jgi:8-oxo-dGTP pyrophosphatase MutT (NUDIX family)